MWADTWVDSGESHALVAVWITFMGYFFIWVSFGWSFWFAWLRIHIRNISGSSYACTHISQARWIPPKRSMGRFDITPLLTSKELSSWEGSPWFQEWEICNMWSLIFYQGRGPASSLDGPSMIFWSFCPQGTNSNALPGCVCRRVGVGDMRWGVHLSHTSRPEFGGFPPQAMEVWGFVPC